MTRSEERHARMRELWKQREEALAKGDTQAVIDASREWTELHQVDLIIAGRFMEWSRHGHLCWN